jgi:hypothetical protein
LKNNDEILVYLITEYRKIVLQHFVNGRPSEKYPDPIPASRYEVPTPCRKAPTKRALHSDQINVPVSASKRRILTTISSNE